MANKNASRLMYFSLSAALSVSLCAGQEQAQPLSGGNGQAVPGSPAGPLQMSLAPPNPPKVTCKGDQLTVLADNSTLESVLTAIHACTGVQIDIPDGAGNSRSFDQLGPGPARQVLTALLNGTDFNYVIESSVADPEKVESVLILARTAEKPTSGVANNVAMTPARRAWLLTQKNGRAVYTGPGNGETSASGATESQGQDDSTGAPTENSGAIATPPPASPSSPQAAETAAPTTQSAVEPPAPVDSTASTPPDKVTDQKITSMQQLFEQRRQMIENQNAPPKPQ